MSASSHPRLEDARTSAFVQVPSSRLWLHALTFLEEARASQVVCGNEVHRLEPRLVSQSRSRARDATSLWQPDRRCTHQMS